MPKKTTATRDKKVVLKAELVFKEGGHLSGFALRASSNTDRKLIDDLMSGEVPGLEYCVEKTIKAVAGGNGSYLLKISDK